MLAPKYHTLGHLFTAVVLGVLVVLPAAVAQDHDLATRKYPSGPEVAELLRKEPLTVESWPAWRTRLISWFGDRSQQTGPAYDAAMGFAKKQANAKGELPPSLAKDYLAWYFLGSAYLYGRPADQPDAGRDLVRAEQAFRRSLSLQKSFARAHRNLARALMGQEEVGWLGAPTYHQAERELAEAQRLDPDLPLHLDHGILALRQKRFV